MMRLARWLGIQDLDASSVKRRALAGLMIGLAVVCVDRIVGFGS